MTWINIKDEQPPIGKPIKIKHALISGGWLDNSTFARRSDGRYDFRIGTPGEATLCGEDITHWKEVNEKCQKNILE